MVEASPETRFFETWLTRVTRHPLAVLLVAALVAAVCLWLAATRLGVDSDTVAMLDEDLPFRQAYSRFQQQFPQLDNTVLGVIEAPTPEQAATAAERLTHALAESPRVLGFSWATGSEFFARHGLLYLDLEQLETLANRLTEAQPLLGRLARQTRADVLLDLLREVEIRAGDQDPPIDRDRLHHQIAETIEHALAGREHWLSWRQLLEPDQDGAPQAYRETLIIDPLLDHERVLAGRPVMQELDRIRSDLGLEQGPTRLYLTGSVALGYEEMTSVIDGARLTGILALIFVTVIMLAGLRSVSLSLIALVNLIFGLAITAGFAALAIGRVNLISVAFVVLYIGLGVNYAVHYLLRYREIGQIERNRVSAVIAAGRFLVRPLTLSAATTALGFFAFVPTAFSGIAQLGLIAGVAMLVTLALSYTTLPAMLALFTPDPSHQVLNTRQGWRRSLAWPIEFRRWLIALGGLLVAASLPLAFQVKFDADPLNLRDADSESVVTIRRLFDSGDGGHRNIQVLLEEDAAITPIRERLAALDSVQRAVTLESFMPADQDAKLMLIEDLGWLLGPDIIDADWQRSPQQPADLAVVATGLAEVMEADTPLAAALGKLARQLQQAHGTELADRVNRLLIGGMQPTLGRLSDGLNASTPVSETALPEWLVSQFRGSDGTRLIQVFPAGDPRDAREQRRFFDQVLAVAGDRATGAPVIQLAAGEAITRAFRQALAWAAIGISLVLLLALRSLSDTARVLAPLVLGGLLTAGVMVLLGIPFNFANVVALPLLLGVAVDNGIHLVLRHRAGILANGNVLESATARAIVFGAMITAGGFGNLAFSPHAGTASLGLILACGLALMVMATLVFVPALLGRRDT